MKLFNNNIVPYASAEGDKIYPIVVDIKKGIKSGEAISFVTADNQVGVITVDFMDGNSSYSIEGCMVTSTIRRPDGTVLEIPCDIISQSTIEIPLGINGTYQEGVHTFDLKIVRGNGKVIGVPTMSYSVSGSLSSDNVVEGDDRLPVLTMVLDNAQDKLTRLDKAIAGATNDLEVKEARDGEVTLNARLERDLEKGKIHFVDVEGSNIATESQEGYLENVEILGNTWQDIGNLADIRSVGTKVEGQELYKIDVVSCGKNLFNPSLLEDDYLTNYRIGSNGALYQINGYKALNGYKEIPKQWFNRDLIFSFIGCIAFYSNKSDSGLISRFFQNTTISVPQNAKYFRIDFNIETSDFQLEEGTQATQYEPYQEDKLTILSPTPLEKVGDVADRIICKDGVWGVEKNINTKILDKEGFTSVEHTLANGIKTVRYVKRISDAKVSGKIISSKYMYDSFCTRDKSIWIHHLESVLWFVDTDMSNLNDFTILVKYQLAESQFIPLPHSQQIKLRTFANKTHISFDTEIEPTIKAQVPKSLGATVNTHTTQIDNLNKELDRVKKLEESTVSTVEAESNFTTVTETSNGYFEDVKLEGKTLVNLSSQVNTTINQFSIVASSRYMLKNSTTYTVIITNKEQHPIRLYGNEQTFVSMSTFEVGSRSTIVKKVHTLDEVKSLGLFKSNSSTGTIFNLDLVLLEGDHTDKDITFFEGLKSVGQSSSGEVDEISVSSVKGDGNLWDGTYEIGSISASNGMDASNGTNRKRSFYIPICETKYYAKVLDYVNTDSQVFIHCYDKNKNPIKWNYGDYVMGVHNNTITLTIPTGGRYLKFRTEDNRVLTPNSVLIAKSDIIKGDTPHQSDKKRLLYYNDETQTWEKPILREWDSIEKHDDGKYYYHKRSGEVVLNGSEHWSYPVSQEGDNTILLYSRISDSKINQNYPICDMFSGTYLNIWEPATDIEGILINHNKDCILRLNKTKLPTQDATGFKQWLQANPTTVVYQLAQEEVYECTNLDLITYSRETNLIVNSGAIQPKLELKVLSNVSNVVKLLQEKVSVLENKFIEGLKQVLSGDMMSLAHLLYPEDFENNHEIQTLEL